VQQALVNQRRKFHNVESAQRSRAKSKMVVASLSATIKALAAQVRELQSENEQLQLGVCTSCSTAAAQLAAASAAMQQIAKVYDCSQFVLDPNFMDGESQDTRSVCASYDI